MAGNASVLIAKIAALPPDRLGEVEDFVDFLAAKTRRVDALDRLLAVAGGIEAAAAAPITEGDIAAEITAVRAARRSRRGASGGAHRS